MTNPTKVLTDDLVNAKPDFLDFMVGGALKKPAEELIAKTPIGNGTAVSAGAKIVSAYALSRVKTGNKYASKGLNGLCIALAVDGCEDATISAKRFLAGRNASTPAAAAVDAGAW